MSGSFLLFEELGFILAASTKYSPFLSLLNLKVSPPSCFNIVLRYHLVLLVSSKSALNFILSTLKMISSLGLKSSPDLTGLIDITLFKTHFPVIFFVILSPEGVICSATMVYSSLLFSGVKLILFPSCATSIFLLESKTNIFSEDSSSSVGFSI